MRILVNGGAGFAGSDRSGRSPEIPCDPSTTPAEPPWFAAVSGKAAGAFDRQPKRPLDNLLDNNFEWLEVAGCTLGTSTEIEARR